MEKLTYSPVPPVVNWKKFPLMSWRLVFCHWEQEMIWLDLWNGVVDIKERNFNQYWLNLNMPRLLNLTGWFLIVFLLTLYKDGNLKSTMERPNNTRQWIITSALDLMQILPLAFTIKENQVQVYSQTDWLTSFGMLGKKIDSRENINNVGMEPLQALNQILHCIIWLISK